MEKCDRCGEAGEDRRTLHMACFYAMDELGLPFGEYAITGEVRPLVSEDRKPLFEDGPMHRIPKFAPLSKRAKKSEHRYFTLRVCKDCRADWMSYIKSWFSDRKENKVNCNSGIFVRRNGATVEISEDEWYRLNPGQEPVRCII